MADEWQSMPLKEAGVQLLDCDHKTPAAVKEGYPYIAIPQLKHGRIDPSDARRITEEDYRTWTRRTKPQAWDVVVSRRCNPGETAYVPPNFDFALGQNLVILRSDGKRIFPPFLRWLLRSPAWWDQVQTFINVGAVFESLKCADIPNFCIPVPPLKEQQAIACILGSLDDKIELNRRMNRTLEGMARAIFKSWFVDFDPVRAKAAGQTPPGLKPALANLFPDRFEDSELGEIPKGWRNVKLGEIADVNWGDTKVTKQSYVEGGFLAYSATGPDGLLPYHNFDRVGVVVSAIGANSGFTWLARGKWSCIKNTIRFWSTVEDVSTEYLYYATRRPNIWPLRGSAQPFISQGDARKVSVMRPAKGLAAVFGKIVGAFSEKMLANDREAQSLAALRDALLPELISGELRVSDVERIVGRNGQ